MAKVQVRGCCFGIPFGCGVLLIALLAVIWGLWPSGWTHRGTAPVEASRPARVAQASPLTAPSTSP
jgi:hypothetical protein